MKKIKNIAILKKILIKDLEKNEYFLHKKGVIVVEYDDFSKNIVDLSTNKDITDDKNIEILAKKGLTKYKYLMESD